MQTTPTGVVEDNMDSMDKSGRHPLEPPPRIRNESRRFTSDTSSLPYPESDLPPQLQRTIHDKMIHYDRDKQTDTMDKEAMEETLRQLFAPEEPPAEE